MTRSLIVIQKKTLVPASEINGRLLADDLAEEEGEVVEEVSTYGTNRFRTCMCVCVWRKHTHTYSVCGASTHECAHGASTHECAHVVLNHVHMIQKQRE